MLYGGFEIEVIVKRWIKNDMNFQDWIPAISTTSLLAFALWLLRSVISTRLTKSVQNEFDGKLEVLRTNLRKSEESFKADLRAKETQIEVLRSGAMSALASRQAALDKRRIEAVDQLWSAVTALAPARWASTLMATIKFDAAAKEAAKNPQLRKIFETIGESIDPKKIGSSDASKARPFVSQISWALFSAYQAIVWLAVTQLQMLKAGLDMPHVINSDVISKIIQVALPHHTDYIQKYGASAYHYLLDELESRLLEELQNILQGAESDKASVKQAAEILKESELLMKSISNTTTT